MPPPAMRSMRACTCSPAAALRLRGAWAASLLGALHLPELIAETPEAYEALRWNWRAIRRG